MRALTIALAALALAAGPAPGQVEGGRTALTVTVWPRGKAAPAYTRTLRCEPPAGTLPRPARACARLRALGPAALQPLPSERACIQRFYGPERALVQGTLAGKRVWARLARTDGCENGRWLRVVFLFAR